MLPRMIWQMTVRPTVCSAGSESLRPQEGSEVFVICAQIEQEIAELGGRGEKMFLEDLGLKESGLRN